MSKDVPFEPTVPSDEMADPFEGMTTSRNSPRGLAHWDWGSWDHGSVGAVFIIGPPTGRTDDELWAAMVVNLGNTFSDFTQLRAYVFPVPGAPRGNRRRVTQPQIRRMVQRCYKERLHAARRLFGVTRIGGWQWCVPSPVRLGFDFALNKADRSGSGGERRRYATEAAHYVFVHGPPGLDAMKATHALEGAEGLKRLLDTWWRL